MAGSITPPQNAGEPTQGRPLTLHDLRRPITVDLYERMIESGVLGPRDRVFLWDGELVAKMTKGRPHVIAQERVDDLLGRIVPEGWHVEQEPPIAVGETRMPEPDVCVIRGTLEDYPHHAPRAGDLGLLVEVAESSLGIDQSDKLEAYAAESIPVYWVVNIPDRQVEVYTEPTGPIDHPTYRTRRVYLAGEAVPVVLDGREVGQVPAADILP